MKKLALGTIASFGLLGTNVPSFSQANATHRVTKDDLCWANVADTGSERWDLKKGDVVTFISNQGSYTRVRIADGAECSIATESIEEAKS